MIDLRQAAEMALEALVKVDEAFLDTEGNYGQMENEAYNSACAAQELLRQALAEPQKWVHLLTDEKEDIRKSVDYSQFMSAEEYACKVQDATEAKLKELNHE